VHSIWDQLLVLRRLFPSRWSDATGFHWSLPLFPDERGNPVTKEAMTDTIRHAALLLDVPLLSPDRSEQVSGHSLRATGAQGFAKAGLDECSIQLLGRWGSKAVRGYTREAALVRSSEWARAVGSSFGKPQPAVPPAMTTKQAQDLLTPLLASAARDIFPKLLAEQAIAWKYDIVEELRSRQRLAEEVPVDHLGATYVKNKITGIIHRLASSSSPELAARATICGWRFAVKSNGVLQRTTDAGVYKLFCDKCLPEERAALKQKLLKA
jgi:hypothetical protein